MAAMLYLVQFNVTDRTLAWSSPSNIQLGVYVTSTQELNSDSIAAPQELLQAPYIHHSLPFWMRVVQSSEWCRAAMCVARPSAILVSFMLRYSQCCQRQLRSGGLAGLHH